MQDSWNRTPTPEEEKLLEQALRKPPPKRNPVGYRKQQDFEKRYCLACGDLLPSAPFGTDLLFCSPRCSKARSIESIRQNVVKGAQSTCQACGRKVGLVETKTFLIEHPPIGPDISTRNYRKSLPLPVCVQTLPGRYSEATVFCFCLWCGETAARRRYKQFPEAEWLVDGKHEFNEDENTTSSE